MDGEKPLAQTDESHEAASEGMTRAQDARIVRAIRNQAEFVMEELDAVVPEDHVVRAIWAFLERLDLSDFYAVIRAVPGRPGRPASDPMALLALWVYATVEGVGSARRLGRLCEEHNGFRWMRGGVPVDYHLLSDFRRNHERDLDDLLSQIVAVLMDAGLVKLEEVAQDGMRVRAGAGSGSYRRKERLEHVLEEAQAQVKRLAQEREHPDTGVSKRKRAARERAARERKERVEHALRELPAVQAAKERQAKRAGKARRAKLNGPRVSTTDPEARVMKMPDGGFRPAHNVQLATDVESQIIVGIDVINRGTDQGEALAMEEQVVRRTGRHPGAYLVDGGYVDLDQIDTLEGKGVRVYAPPKQRKDGQPVSWKRGTTPPVQAWRERMESEEGKAIYRHRASSAECVNALARERYGLQRFRVRGLAQATCAVLLMVITHDLLRWASLTA